MRLHLQCLNPEGAAIRRVIATAGASCAQPVRVCKRSRTGMGQHRLPALANRLRVNRGFESAWFSDVHYAELLQKDWTLARQAWSLITRASRSTPRQALTLSQQLQQLRAVREAINAGKSPEEAREAAAAALKSSAVQAQGLAGADYPNNRVARMFTQQLPYKSVVSTFAYGLSASASGPQGKYGLFKNNSGADSRDRRPRSDGPGGQQRAVGGGERSRGRDGGPRTWR
jgi:hypothetical protein